MAFDIKFTGQYMAIKDFKDWNNISGLVVLTGHNGSGKSQFLRLIDARVNSVHKNRNNEYLKKTAANIQILGESFKQGEVLLFNDSHNLASGGGVSFIEFHTTATKMLEELKGANPSYFQEDNASLQALKKKILKTIEEKGFDIRKLEIEEFKNIIEEDWLVHDISQVYKNLSQVFRKYHSELQEHVMLKKISVDNAEAKWKKESPWSKLNQLFEKTTLGFRLTDCWGLPAHSPYKLEFINTNGITINPNDLSAGEKSITKILLLTFIHSYKNARPKLILLDEQDAHLEPSAIDNFLASIKNTLVDSYNCHVILTSHRSETIAFAPEESLYELKKNPSEIIKIEKDEAISKISSNLLKVWTQGQLVLVEADDDQRFYSANYNWATKIMPELSDKKLNFISEQTKGGTGGNQLVMSHVEKMKGFTKGILDGDGKTDSPPLNIKRIKRYSIENYYLDPHILLSLLLANGKFISSEANLDQEVSAANLSDVQNLSEANLQKFADWIYAKIQAQKPTFDNSSIEVEYTNGKKIKVPKWLLTTKGHELIGIFQTTTSCRVICNDELHKHAGYQSSMIAKDLIELFEQV